jgi:hypothetical protein
MRTILRNAIVGLTLAILATATTSVLAQGKDLPEVGTWKLNVEKSRYSPGPAPKNLTVKIVAAGKGIKFSSEGIAADGKPIATEYATNFDGKDYPLKGSQVADTVSVRRIDPQTAERTDKKAGKAMLTQTREVAKDGKGFTVNVTGTNDKGEPVNHRLFFERQ